MLKNDKQMIDISQDNIPEVDLQNHEQQVFSFLMNLQQITGWSQTQKLIFDDI